MTVSEAIEKLRACSQINIQANWRYWQTDIPITETQSNWLKSPIAQLNAKNHITWSSGKQVLWLAQRLVIPHNLQGYPLEGLTLRLALTWWAEAAQIFVNNCLVQDRRLI